MTEIIVQLKKPSIEGRLHYKPSVENIKHGMLYVESQQSRRMAYCMNVHGGQLLLYFDTQRLLSHGRKITFRIRSMLAKQVRHDQVYRRTASHENNQEETHPSMPV